MKRIYEGYRAPDDDIEAFAARVWVSNGCWAWTGGHNDAGYGQMISLRERGLKYAHRFAYELIVGPIPDGLVLDHLCRHPGCCNPSHLEPVTQQENALRGHASLRAERAAAAYLERAA